jgi:hypothetical protein
MKFFVIFALATVVCGEDLFSHVRINATSIGDHQAGEEANRINPTNCGIRNNETSSLRKRYLSATRSNQKDWGWLVLLGGSDGYTSGNLINSQWVLTHAQNIE